MQPDFLIKNIEFMKRFFTNIDASFTLFINKVIQALHKHAISLYITPPTPICCYSTSYTIIHSPDCLCKNKPYDVNPTFALMMAVLHSVWFLCKTNLEHSSLSQATGSKVLQGLKPLFIQQETIIPEGFPIFVILWWVGCKAK